MKIGITAFPYDKGKSGIWNYIKSLITGIAAMDGDNEYYIFTPYDFKLRQKNITQVLFASKWINNPIVNIIWHQLYLPYIARRFDLDLLHLPAGNRRLVWFRNCKIVTTVHDLSQFHVKNKYDVLRMFYIKKVLSLMTARISRIIVVSDSTKKDVVKYWKAEEKNVIVLPNGVGKDFLNIKETDREKTEETLGKYKIGGAFIFYVSRLEHPGKNHVTLIKAYERLRQETDLTHKLVLAGSSWTRADAIFKEAERSKFSSDIIFAGYVPDDDMPSLYTAASLFVFPSLHEGFGIPLLEAMACGTPVVCSNISSMPEVVGDCGLLFDPQNPEDIAEKMKTMLKDGLLREQCVKRGLERVRAFSWEEIVKKTVQIYREVCGS